ncbi:hypothetical protein RAS1_25270 [Phycisphaerae bacterium RAS1]|nr:hypothetical protein RAS1_25270 [Phycisphaerae bacterium RAS1]
MLRRWIPVILVGASSVAALAQTSGGRTVRPPTARVSQTLRLLNQQIPEVSFEEIPLESVIDWIANQTQANVKVRWQTIVDAGVERDKPISLKLKNLRLSAILWLILNEAGGGSVKLAYRAAGDLLVISTEEDLNKEMVTKVYDIADLLARPPLFRNAAQLDPAQALQAVQQSSQGGQGGFGGRGGGGGGGGGGQLFQSGQQNRQEDNAGGDELQRLIDLITQTIEPDTWTQGGGQGTIHAFRSTIVVRNTLIVHQQINGYVEDAAEGP